MNPLLKKFLWRWSLAEGTKFIGWLEIALSLPVIAVMIYLGIGYNNPHYANGVPVFSDAFKTLADGLDLWDPFTEPKKTGVRCFALAGLTAIYVIVTGMMLWCVYKRKAKGMTLWMIGTVLGLVRFAFYRMISGGPEDIAFNVIAFIVKIYFLIVVFSHYLELTNEEKQKKEQEQERKNREGLKNGEGEELVDV